MDVRLFDDLFDDKIKPRDVVVAEPELGLGPLHTAYDGRGNAYTTLFLDSQVVQVEHRRGQARLQGREGRSRSSRSSTSTISPATTTPPWARPRRRTENGCISLNKFSKDRFLNVGPLKPENDQLIDISGDKMMLVHDGPSFAEPHDATIVHRSKIKPLISIWKRADPMFADARKQAQPTASSSKPTPRSSATATRCAST